MRRLYSFQLNARENQEHTRYQPVCCEKETRRAAVKPGLEEALLPKSPDDAFVSDQPAVPVVAPGNRGTRGEMPSIRA